MKVYIRVENPSAEIKQVAEELAPELQKLLPNFEVVLDLFEETAELGVRTPGIEWGIDPETGNPKHIVLLYFEVVHDYNSTCIVVTDRGHDQIMDTCIERDYTKGDIVELAYAASGVYDCKRYGI